MLRSASVVLEEYEKNRIALENNQLIKQIREAVSFIDPYTYRGISRDPLAPWSSEDEKNLRETPELCKDLQKELSARKKLRELTRINKSKSSYCYNGWQYNEKLVSSLDEAKEIYGCLCNPGEYEIVELSREPYSTDFKFLGYDVGYWAGDHFSIICDSVLMPQWHPPSPEDITELANQLHGLNKYILFPSLDEAIDFRRYYTSMPWAEQQMFHDDFCIIQIALP